MIPTKNGEGTRRTPHSEHHAARPQPIPAGTVTPRPARCQVSSPKRINGTAKLPGPAQKVTLVRQGIRRLPGVFVGERERDGCPYASIDPAGDFLPGGERRQDQVPRPQRQHDPARPAK